MKNQTEEKYKKKLWYQIKHGWIKKVEIVSKCAKKRLFKWDETIEGIQPNYQ